MVDFSTLSRARVAVYGAVVVVGGAIGGYAVHEHHTAQDLAAQNVQTTAALNETKHEVSDLTSKVNTLVARAETQAAPTAPAAQTGTGAPRAAAPRRPREDSHYKKLQSQLDAQGKAIEQTRTDLASTQGDLVSARTELTGSIAHTHDELVVLQKKGERNYTEFDISKSKEFQREGPFSVRLKKANDKHQYADLELIVEDRTLSQKHVNLYQPVMFYAPDSPQPVEVVINSISKDHIHGYVSASKYRQSELASMANAGTTASPVPAQAAADSSDRPTLKQRPTTPQ